MYHIPLRDVVLRDSTIYCAFSGYVTAEDSNALKTSCSSLLGAARFVVIDFTLMSGYESAIRAVALSAMEEWRDNGIELVLGISESGLARMVGTAIGLATNLPLRFVSSQAEVEAKLAPLRAQPKGP